MSLAGEPIGPANPGPFKEPTGIYERSPGEGTLQQGELLSGVAHQFLNLEQLRGGNLAVDETAHRYVIVASQSCDLQWDFEARKPGGEPDKLLHHIMLYPAFTAEEVKSRKSLKGDPLHHTKTWASLKINKDERYHFFEAVPPYEDALGDGLPELVVDFKHYFSLPTAELYWKLTQEAKRRSRLVVPYLEHFATRCFQFQSRVATPRQHLST